MHLTVLLGEALLNTPVTTVLFDLDGTLIDSLPDLAESGAALLGSYGLTPPAPESVRAMIGDGARKLVERLLIAAGDTGPIDRDEALERFLAFYTPRAALKTRLFPGVKATLQTLVENGIACAICTNKPAEAARLIVEKLGLSPLIDAIGGGDSFSVRKPDPGHVIKTLRLMGRPVSGAAMIGDHRNDMLAARDAGLPGIFAAWGYGDASMSRDATAIARRIEDVPSLLEKVTAL